MRRMMAASMALALTGCGGATSGALPAAGPVPATPAGGVVSSAASSVMSSASCALPAAPLAETPLVASWPSAQVSALHGALARGIAVVHYDGCSVRVLEQCRAEGSYRFVATKPASGTVPLTSETALTSHVFADYKGLFARVRGGAQLALELAVTGSLEASKAIVLPTSLVGDCEGATHYVTSVLVGSHAIRDEGAAAPASTTASAPPAERALLDGEPSPAACAAPGANATSPSPSCRHELRAQLAPVRAIDFPAAKSHDERACPDDAPLACLASCAGMNLSACTNLAWMLEKGNRFASDPARSAMLYRGACFAGYGVACNNLSVLFLEGRGVEKDPSQAAPLLRMACNGGYAHACANLGTLYRDGVGVKKDAARALTLYRGACDAADGEGCGLLGSLLGAVEASVVSAANAAVAAGAARAGEAQQSAKAEVDARQRDAARSVDDARGAVDAKVREAEASVNAARGAIDAKVGEAKSAARLALARAALVKGCVLGDGDSCNNLGVSMLDVPIADRNEASALRSFGLACAKGVAQGCRNMGNLYALGLGTKRDAERAAASWAAACNLGSTDACERLAEHYVTGRDAQLRAKGLALLEATVGKESLSGMERLVDAYRSGALTDPHKAFELARKACEAGSSAACTHIAELAPQVGKLGKSPQSWLEPLCNAGKVGACTAVADLRAKGVSGVVKDVASARAAYERACEAGEFVACKRGGELLALTNAAPSLDGAAAMFGKACDHGDASSCRSLSQLLARGERLAKDPRKALELVEHACAMADGPSCADAAALHRAAAAGGALPARAQEFYARACNAGVETACGTVAGLPPLPAPPDPLAAAEAAMAAAASSAAAAAASSAAATSESITPAKGAK